MAPSTSWRSVTMDGNEKKSILLVMLAPTTYRCKKCGHESQLTEETFALFLVAPATDCPACGQPIIITSAQHIAGGKNHTIH